MATSENSGDPGVKQTNWRSSDVRPSAVRISAHWSFPFEQTLRTIQTAWHRIGHKSLPFRVPNKFLLAYALRFGECGSVIPRELLQQTDSLASRRSQSSPWVLQRNVAIRSHSLNTRSGVLALEERASAFSNSGRSKEPPETLLPPTVEIPKR